MLEGNYLTFFENFNVQTNLAEKRKGIVPVLGCTIKQLPSYDRNFCLEITHPDRLSLVLSCENEHALGRWFGALSQATREKVIANVNGTA